MDDPVCLPSVGRSGYRALDRSRSWPCDLDAPRERPRSGPTDNRYVVESARAGHLAMPSERFTLDLSPRLPVCCPMRDSHAAGAGFPRADRNPVVGISNGLLWAAIALPISATHVRRAGTPASRESSSARGSRLGPRSPSHTVSRTCWISWRLLASTIVANRAHSLLAQPASPGRICTRPLDTGERATSFSRFGCLHPLRVLPVWCESGDRPRPGRARPGFTPAVR